MSQRGAILKHSQKKRQDASRYSRYIVTQGGLVALVIAAIPQIRHTTCAMLKLADY